MAIYLLEQRNTPPTYAIVLKLDLGAPPAPIVTVTEIDGTVLADPIQFRYINEPSTIDNVQIDYLSKVEAMAQNIVLAGGFAALGESEKPYAAKYASYANGAYIVCTGADMLAEIPDYDQRKSLHAARISTGRGARASEGVCSLWRERSQDFEATLWAAMFDTEVLGVPVPYLVLKELACVTPRFAGDLTLTYLDIYRTYGENAQIIDYLNGASDFVGIGFLDNYGLETPQGFASMTDLRDYLLQTIQYGNLNTAVF